MSTTYDAIIVGAGHNGLVTAAYLAKPVARCLVAGTAGNGWRMRHDRGALARLQGLHRGYVNSLLRPEIIRDLELKRHGFEMLPRSPSSFTPYPDGRYLMMGPDQQMTLREIAKFTQEGRGELSKVRSDAHPGGGLPGADADPDAARPVLEARRRHVEAREDRLRLPGSAARRPEAIEILTGAATPILNRWFESEQLKSTIATDAVIGAFAPPSAPGTAYVLFHHVMGECNGVRGVWGYVRGHGARCRTASHRRPRPTAPRFAPTHPSKDSGEERPGDGRRARRWNRVPRQARDQRGRCERDLQQTHGCEGPAGRVPGGDPPHRDYSSATVKINVALSEPPQFNCLPGTGVGPQHHGTMHICPALDYIERAYDDAKYGRSRATP